MRRHLLFGALCVTLRVTVLWIPVLPDWEHVEVTSRSRDLRASLEDDAVCKRKFGAAMAKKLKLRFDALRAAESLADFWPPKSGPERCHELLGESKGVFSIDV